MREMGKLTLGMPGQWAEDDKEAADHYTTKVGGLPDWPTMDINPDMLKCGLCSGKLYLLAQVYAPISSGNFSVEERTIYVLGCPTPKCASSSRGWRTLRVQKCRSESQSRVISQGEEAPAECSNPPSSINNWWATDAWMQASGEQRDGNVDDVDLKELTQAILEASSHASCAKKKNMSRHSEVVSKDFKEKPRPNDSSIAGLPCFYIYNQEERSLHNTSNIHNQYASLSIKENTSLPADSAEEENWEPESYEYDKALGADRTYLKFKKRLEAYPEQCIRYWFGGKPLLATNVVGELGSCGLCGAQRHYELQLMPPLLYFLQQAADGQSTYSPEGWTWMTIIIYTCSKNCFHQSCEGNSGGGCWTVSEESTIIQCE